MKRSELKKGMHVALTPHKSDRRLFMAQEAVIALCDKDEVNKHLDVEDKKSQKSGWHWRDASDIRKLRGRIKVNHITFRRVAQEWVPLTQVWMSWSKYLKLKREYDKRQAAAEKRREANEKKAKKLCAVFKRYGITAYIYGDHIYDDGFKLETFDGQKVLDLIRNSS